MHQTITIPKIDVPRSATAIAMRARAQKAGPHRDRRQGRGNPRSEARRQVRGEAS